MSTPVGQKDSLTNDSGLTRNGPLTPEQKKTEECGCRVLRRRCLNFDQPPLPLKIEERKKETPETITSTGEPGAWFCDSFGEILPGSPGFSPITNSRSIDVELWRLLETGSQEDCISLVEESGAEAIADIQPFLKAASAKSFFDLYATLQVAQKAAVQLPPPDISPIRSRGPRSLLPAFNRAAELEAAAEAEEQLADAFALGDEEQCLQILYQLEVEVPSADEFFSQAVDQGWWSAAQLLASHVSETFDDEGTIALCMLGRHTEIISTVLQRSKAARDAALTYLCNMENLGIDAPGISNLFQVVLQLSTAVQFGNQTACSEGLQIAVPVIPGADGFFVEAVRREWWPEAEILAHHISEKFGNNTTICSCIAANQVKTLATILDRSKIARRRVGIYLQALEKTDTMNGEIRDLFLQYQEGEDLSSSAESMEPLPVEHSSSFSTGNEKTGDGF